VPGALDVIGSATNTATVTVNNSPTYRKGNYYRTQLALANGSAPVWQSVTNLAVVNNGTNADIATNINGNVYLPQTPENFTYDPDGNIAQDGRWQYSWDGENRLVSMQAISAVPTAAKYKLDFVYDWQSRRVQKTVSTNNGSAYYPQGTNRFAYDGWNLLAILNPQSSLVQAFVWGLDLSGSLKGAGGVGGLLVLGDAANGCHFVGFDGNGNVSTLTKTSDGTPSAQYGYGPFGELSLSAGPMAKANLLRFSTKYYDDESDIIWYGYRHYNSSTGRWQNRAGSTFTALSGTRPRARSTRWEGAVHRARPRWMPALATRPPRWRARLTARAIARAT
jgi:RHS repeat-associated protein